MSSDTPLSDAMLEALKKAVPTTVVSPPPQFTSSLPKTAEAMNSLGATHSEHESPHWG